MNFNVSVFADTTINERFDYWIVMGENVANVDPQIGSTSNAWIETVPKRDSLTGLGPRHRDDKLYTYMLHPDSSGGSENLRQFKVTKSMPNKKVSVTLAGSDGDVFNTTCAPGSYWGPNPQRWNSLSQTLLPSQVVVADTVGDPRGMFDKLMYLPKLEAATWGKKEFILVTRFTGRFFNDVRVMLSGGKLFTSTRYAHYYAPAYSYFDVYPPVIYLDEPNDIGCFLNNGSVIASNFCYALSKSSVADLGKANVSAIQLLIAKKPADDLWSAENATRQDLLNLRAEILEYPIKIPKDYVNEVRWDNIDPSNWPSGQYVMAIWVSDEFGNEGFARFFESGYTNPWVVDVQTGR
jgi:hypothetical protein